MRARAERERVLQALPASTYHNKAANRERGAAYGGTAYWRYVDGKLEWDCERGHGDEHRWAEADDDGARMFINPKRVALLAELMANPTETVEDE